MMKLKIFSPGTTSLTVIQQSHGRTIGTNAAQTIVETNSYNYNNRFVEEIETKRDKN